MTSPFAPKPRSFSDFNITTTEDPRPRYMPGDKLKGAVNLKIIKPTKLTHITVAFHGFVKVYRNPTAPGEGNPMEAALLKGSAAYGSGSALIFEQEKIVCGEGRLNVGRYCFGYEFRFPSSPLPSSLDVCYLGLQSCDMY